MVRVTLGRLQGQQGTAGLSTSMASGFHEPACGHGYYTLCSKLHPYPRHRAVSGSGQGRDFPWAA